MGREPVERHEHFDADGVLTGVTVVHRDPEFTPAGVAYFQQVIAGMKEQGCDAVVLGCTEIPLIINDANSALPTLDSTRLLARAALKRAVGSKAMAA